MHGILDHIEIYVSDLENSTQFWGWLLPKLGFSSFQCWDSGRSWRNGDFYLVIVQVDQRFSKLPFHRKQVGLNHVAFRVDSPADVDELANELRDSGVGVLYEDRHPYAGGGSHYAVYFEDPDRIKVEVVASSSKGSKAGNQDG